MFPGPNAQIIRNEAGEVLGWDYPLAEIDDYYCDECGFNHSGPCPIDDEEEDEQES